MNSRTRSASYSGATGPEPKLKKVRLQCDLLLRGVQFNPKANQETLQEELFASLGVTAGRLDEVSKEIAAGPSIDASADPLEKFAQGLSKGVTFEEMTHNVCALFLSNAHDLPKTPALSEDPYRYTDIRW
jgi:hypothetical protein